MDQNESVTGKPAETYGEDVYDAGKLRIAMYELYQRTGKPYYKMGDGYFIKHYAIPIAASPTDPYAKFVEKLVVHHYHRLAGKTVIDEATTKEALDAIESYRDSITGIWAPFAKLLPWLFRSK